MLLGCLPDGHVLEPLEKPQENLASVSVCIPNLMGRLRYYTDLRLEPKRFRANHTAAFPGAYFHPIRHFRSKQEVFFWLTSNKPNCAKCCKSDARRWLIRFELRRKLASSAN